MQPILLTPPDFIHHPDYGVAALTPGQKAHIDFRAARLHELRRSRTPDRPTLQKALDQGRAVLGRYGNPDDDDMPPGGAPAMAVPVWRAA